jgi:hypothetical protein
VRTERVAILNGDEPSPVPPPAGVSEMTKSALDLFSAAASSLGFFYQYRYALLLMLEGIQTDPGIEITVEKVDDVTVGARGQISDAVQTKLHAEGAKALTDSSKDLWSTLRVWCEGIGSGDFDLNAVKFLLVTTADVAATGLTRFLRPDGDRDPDTALGLLLHVARKSRSEENAKSYSCFLDMDEGVRRTLVHAIHIIDHAPTADDLDERITRAVGFVVEPAHTPSFVRALQGRWLRRIEDHLAGPRDDVITGYEVHDWLRELRGQYRPDNLPTELEFEEPPDSIWRAVEEYTFVRQLRHIGLSDDQIAFAVRDYYQAFEQRGRWVREKLLHLNETERYNLRLVDAWAREFAEAKRRLAASADPTEEIKSGVAIDLYQLIQRADHRIRPECSAPFVMRGSYQMLADEPKIGWHPEWDRHFGTRERRRAG